MGHTHNWLRQKDFSRGWKEFLLDVQKIFRNLPTKTLYNHQLKELKIVSGCESRGSGPIINDHMIMFNGEGELGHETFFSPRKLELLKKIRKISPKK